MSLSWRQPVSLSVILLFLRLLPVSLFFSSFLLSIRFLFLEWLSDCASAFFSPFIYCYFGFCLSLSHSVFSSVRYWPRSKITVTKLFHYVFNCMILSGRRQALVYLLTIFLRLILSFSCFSRYLLTSFCRLLISASASFIISPFAQSLSSVH